MDHITKTTRVCIGLSLLVIIGCGGTSDEPDDVGQPGMTTGTNNASGTTNNNDSTNNQSHHTVFEPTPTDACSDHDEGACDADPSCRTIHGTPIDLEGGCYETLAFAGCLHDSRGCGSDSTPEAIAPDGSCWSFGDDCVPGGWAFTRSGNPCNQSTFGQLESCENLD